MLEPVEVIKGNTRLTDRKLSEYSRQRYVTIFSRFTKEMQKIKNEMIEKD